MLVEVATEPEAARHQAAPRINLIGNAHHGWDHQHGTHVPLLRVFGQSIADATARRPTPMSLHGKQEEHHQPVTSQSPASHGAVRSSVGTSGLGVDSFAILTVTHESLRTASEHPLGH
jgi:hypothetical protein